MGINDQLKAMNYEVNDVRVGLSNNDLYDEIVNNNISKFHPILKSLNTVLIQTESKAGKTFMSNIIDF